MTSFLFCTKYCETCYSKKRHRIVEALEHLDQTTKQTANVIPESPSLDAVEM